MLYSLYKGKGIATAKLLIRHFYIDLSSLTNGWEASDVVIIGEVRRRRSGLF
jgi:hypothetical protein